MGTFENAMKMLWTGRCDIYNYETYTDEWGISRSEKVLAACDVPCRISYKTYKRDRAGEQSETVNELAREVRLIMGNDVKVRAGASFVVRQNGEERRFMLAGIPAVYWSHQEVMLCDEEEVG